MKQRCWAHDYCAPSFYMLTFVTEPRRNCLSVVEMQRMQEQGAAPATEPRQPPPPNPGSVVGAAPAGSVVGAAPAPTFLTLSPLGQTVREVWQRTTSTYPGVEACECVAMPDHFHGILWVKERLSRHVGHIIKAFKRVSEGECRSRGLLLPRNPGSVVGAAPAGSVVGAAPAGSVVGAAPAPTLWQQGYQDTILLRRGQLKAMANYIADNPRRLAVKRANPNLFTVARNLTVAPGRTCPGCGNLFLLDRPIKRQVQISRSISEEALADKKEELLYAARRGAVLVSPCISPGEKEIARAALDAELPLIVLLANGFAPLYKPAGRYFDACANGHLLMLAPFPYHREKQPITREQCLTLNEWAGDAVNSGGSEQGGA